MHEEKNSENIRILLNNLLEEAVSRKIVQTALFLSDDSTGCMKTISRFISQTKTKTCCRHIRLHQQSCSPLHPFLGWIGESLKGRGQEELLALFDKAEVYYSFRKPLLMHFEGRPCSRSEEVIPEELEYEKQKLNESVLSLFCAAGGGCPSIVIIDNIKRLPLSTLAFLDCISGMPSGAPVLLILIHNMNNFYDTGKLSSRAGTFISSIESKASIVDARVHNYSTTETPEVPQAVPDRHELEKLLSECTAFLAFDDALAISDLLDSDRSGSGSGEQRLTLLLERGKLLFYQRKTESAIMTLSRILSADAGERHPGLLHEAYRMLSLCFYIKDNIDNAQKYASLSMKLAEASGDERRLFNSLFTLLLIDDRENRMEKTAWIDAFRKIITLAEKLGYRNSLAFWLTRHDRFDQVEHSGEIARMIDEAITIASEIRNTMRLAAAYHAKGLFYIHNNEYDKVKHWYTRSEQLSVANVNTRVIAQICNGFGYFHLQNGQYRNAEHYFLRALEFSYRAKDFHEILMAMCNAASNYMLCLDFARASAYFENLILIMKNLGITDLPFHSQFGIHCLAAICHYNTRNTSKFLEYYAFIRKTLSAKTGHARLQNLTEEELHYKLISGYYYTINGDTAEAEAHFRSGEALLKAKYSLIKYMYPFFCSQTAAFYRKVLRHDAAAEALEKGREISGTLSNAPYTEYFRQQLKNAKQPKSLITSKGKLTDFGKFLELSSVSQSLTQLNRRVEELDFLYSFQNAVSHAGLEEELVEAAGRLFGTGFSLSSFSITRSGSEFRELLVFRSAGSDDALAKDQFLRLGSVLQSRPPALIPQERMADLPDAAGLGFSSLISIPITAGENANLHFLFGSSVGDIPFNDGDFVILNIAAREFVNGMMKIGQDREIREKNAQLEEANAMLYRKATTDPLTGLHNRQSLLSRMRELRELGRRRSAENPSPCSLMFIDLDGFKHYNDTFGHQAGDTVLVEFAAILQQTVRICDIAARYGGDEFVILMPETGRQGAAVLAERILKSMEKDGSLIQSICSKLPVTAGLSSEMRLGCSIGITSSEAQHDAEIENLIRQADSALYESKRNGRNRYTVYAEV